MNNQLIFNMLFKWTNGLEINFYFRIIICVYNKGLQFCETTGGIAISRRSHTFCPDDGQGKL